KHFNKNFCTEIAIWDYLFGTAYKKYDEYPEATGVADFATALEEGRSPAALLRVWLALNLHPFRMIGRSISGRWRAFARSRRALRTESPSREARPEPPA